MAGKELEAWHPGSAIAHLTLGEVLVTLLGDEPGAIPWQVRLLENPASRLAFPGAISLPRHDCIHVLLGKGTCLEGECYVVGFTMAAASSTKSWHLPLFWLMVKILYPSQFQPSTKEWGAFFAGSKAARSMQVKDLHLIPLERMEKLTVGQVREILGIIL